MDDGQADGKLDKGQAHNQSVGAYADEQRTNDVFLDLQDHFFGMAAHLAQAESHQLIVVRRDKKGGYD